MPIWQRNEPGSGKVFMDRLTGSVVAGIVKKSLDFNVSVCLEKLSFYNLLRRLET